MNLEIGALTPPISTQLERAGIRLGDDAAFLDRLFDAVNLLHVHQIISPSQFDSCGKKLIKKVQREVTNYANRQALLQKYHPRGGAR
jgi:hypothetical protein